MLLLLTIWYLQLQVTKNIDGMSTGLRHSELKSSAQKLLWVLKSPAVAESVVHVHVCWGAGSACARSGRCCLVFQARDRRSLKIPPSSLTQAPYCSGNECFTPNRRVGMYSFIFYTIPGSKEKDLCLCHILGGGA